jgi:putative intracellular protease/amidase
MPIDLGNGAEWNHRIATASIFEETSVTQHVLFIVTNAAVIGPQNRKTGFFFAEVAHPFDVLDTAGVAIEFASPAGGWTPYDAYDEKDTAQKAFFESKAFRRLNHSRKLSEVDAADYDAILVPGGLGPMVDIQRNADVQKAVLRAWTTGKLVTAVCHGPCALLGVDLGDGKPFIRGRKLTGFSKKEESDYARDDVPYELEDALTAEGADYSSVSNWQPHVVVDGRLITGQNPASAGPLAKELLAALKRAATPVQSDETRAKTLVGAG